MCVRRGGSAQPGRGAPRACRSSPTSPPARRRPAGWHAARAPSPPLPGLPPCLGPGDFRLGHKMYPCCSTVTLEQDPHKKMHIWMLQTVAVALTSLVLSWAESIEYYGEICDNACPCEEKDGILTVSCENRGIISLFEISPPRFPVYHLLLSGNLLNRLYPNQFVNYTGASILHLGSNDIQDIETGAFHGLRGLRRLHLNNNKLELLRDDTFLGLESLEYLQVDYNYISTIEPNAFSKLHFLQVLILNDNLLSSLPHNLFRFVPLTHLDLRGNRLKLLPYLGLLQHMDKVVELQLEENPWNCSCELIALKDWLDSISYSALVGDVVCETPFRLHGRDLDEVSKQELCPRRLISDYEMRPQTPLSTTGYFHTTPASVNSVATSSSAVYKSPLKPPKGTRQPNKTRVRPTSRLPSKDLGYSNYGPSIAYQTKSPVPLECPTACTCNLQISDLGLNVNCQERKIESISELQPKPYNPKKMYLTENYIALVRRADFLDATGLDLLHLGNNRISVIQDRAFGDLTNLRRLYLNGNRLERLTPELFYGLQSLQYLFLQYNVIRDIEAGTFESVPNLQLLFLNNNLLRSLPANVFSGLTLSRLSLRSNHFSSLPVSGVLDQLRALLQIDLHENPWDCTCDVVGMKLWLEQLNTGVLVDQVLCESPKKFAQSDMRSLRAELLCPDYSDVVVSTPTPSSVPLPARPTLFPATVRLNSTGAAGGAAGPGGGAPTSSVPLSVLILSLLLVFIMSVFVAAGLFVLVMKRRKKGQGDPAGANNSDVSSFNMHYSVYGGSSGGGGHHPHPPPPQPRHPRAGGPALPKVKTPAGHVYEYIPHPLGHMCKNPIYRSREGNAGEDYKDLHELKVTYSNHHLQQGAPPAPPAGDGEPLRSPAYSVSTIEPREELLSPVQDADRFYRGILEPEKHSPSSLGVGPPGNNLPEYPKFPAAYTYSPNYDLMRPHQYLHPGPGDSRLRETVLYSPPSTVYVEPNRNEYLELKAKLNAEPDYLEVLEKQTTFSQF
ncbi:SLIT and NTRK-like protein 5 isoform X1 [Carettochelys insculpta]|uniref:SLIT and NTRK-like protein 5 isoform X1 n=2 Tax=Carettochelys insculpta TaxID=44489 RepID=UPI003EB7AB3B